MKKYKIAKGKYKGIELKYSLHSGKFWEGFSKKDEILENMIFNCHADDLQIYLDAGIIEEIQETTWTDKDMVEFIRYCYGKARAWEDSLEMFKQLKGVKND